MPSPTNPYRLSRSVVPSAYRIFLTPNLDKATFAGRVEIDVEVNESSDRVTLNSLDLELGAATLTAAGRSHRSGEPDVDTEFETATFVFDDEFPRGPATIEIAFSGVLNDMLHGFYRSTYTDDDGTTHTIATSQLQESHARRAFPCWDEPSFKATFQTNLTVPRDLAAYSNSPVINDTDLGNGQRTVSFAPTMIMSTYLNAFIVGPFEETAAVDVLGTPVRIVYPVGKGHLTDFAMEATAFSLSYFSEYFDIAYPGEKLDMIAIPDFAFGAMENLGCVTFREADLLIDPARASLAERRRVMTVVAHETAHMWFGDLVTMDWWEGIWLNEAFATFMEALCSDAMHPEWACWVDFGVERDRGLRIDGLHETRPIEFPVLAPADSLAMVDVLTYQKGGSVLRMLEQYLGATVFRDAIRHYLRRHSYANTVTSDLWDALEEVSGKPVRDLMNTWILQGGHPLVTLESGRLHQEPFAYGPRRGASAIGSTWKVPVLVRSLGGAAPSDHLLGVEDVEVAESSPVLVNAGGSGVYRTRYGAAELAALVGRLDELTALERTTLVADSWALLYSSRTTWAEFYSVARGLGDRDEPSTWSTVATALDYVDRALLPEQRAKIAAATREIFTPQWERLGWEPRQGESELAAQMRAVVLGVLGTTGRDDAVIDGAIARFEAGELVGELAGAILGVVAAHGDARHYETFLERYRSAEDPLTEQRYLRALAVFGDPDLALNTATMCFSEVRFHDSPNALAGLMGARTHLTTLTGNRESGPEVWRYVANRWDDALKLFPPYLLPRLTWGVATFITDAALADEVEAFHSTHVLTESQQRQVRQSIELMRVGLALTAAVRPQF